MTITDVGNLFMFAGGLGMFLYGMHSMSGGIQKTAGNKMKELLGILTSNHFMAVVVGALVTASSRAAVPQRLWWSDLSMRAS